MNLLQGKTRRIIAGVLAGLVVIIVLAVTLGGHSTPKPAAATTPTTSAPLPAVSQPTQPPTTPAPPPTTQAPAPAPSTPSTPAMTSSQQQAVAAAQGYLSDGEGFSAYSLNQQLTSSAGNGFSAADAQFAINYLNPDWNAQAVDAANGYLNDGEGFSKSSLTQQLTSTYGNGFTYAQATYAVNKTMG